MALDIFRLSGRVEIDTDPAEKDLKRLEGDAKRSATNLDSAFRNKKPRVDVSGAKSDLRSLESAASRSASAVKGAFAGAKIGDFGVGSLVKGNLISGAIQSALGGVTGAMQDAWKIGIEYQKTLENATVRMSRFFQTAQQTDAFVSSVEKFAAVSPIFEMKGAVQGAQRLLDMKFAASEVIPALSAIGDVVGGVGGGAEEIDRVTLALSQMASKQKITSEELSQIAEVGVPVWTLLAKAINRTEAETRTLVEQGRVGVGALKGIIAMGGEMFAGQSEKALKTLSGQQQQFESSVAMKLGQMTKGSFDQLKGAYASATEGFTSGAADNFAKEVDRLLTDMGKKVEPALQKMATGEYFQQGLTALTEGRDAKEQFDKGNYGQALSSANRATEAATGMPLYDWKGIGLEGTGPLGIFTGGKKVTLGDLFGGGDSLKEQGKQAGAQIGQGVQDGVKENLQMKSPSKVMIALGEAAAMSFGVGFEQGKKKIQPIKSEDLYGKFGEQSEEVKKAMEATLGKAGAGRLAKQGIGFAPGFFTSGKPEVDAAIKSNAARTGVPSELLFAQQMRESRFNVNAVSAAGAEGPAQFMPGTAKRFKLKNPFDPAEATRAQADYMKFLKNKFAAFSNAEQLALAGYNAGENRKSLAAGRVPNIIETKEYIAEISAVIGMIRETAPAASSALAVVAQKLSDLTAKATTFAGSTLPKGGDGASAQPFTAARAVVLPNVATASVQLASLASGAEKLAPPLSAMKSAIESAPPPVTATANAIKTATSRAGEWETEIKGVSAATGEAIDHFAQFKDAIAGGFDDLFDAALNGEKFDFKSIGKQLFKGLTGSLISGISGGRAQSPGQLLSGALFGFGGGSGGSSGGGNAAASATGGGGGSGAVGGLLGNIMSGSKVGGLLGKIPILGKLFGGGAAASKTAFVEGALTSAFGPATAATTAGAGAAKAGLLGGLFSNPVTGVIAGALIAAPFIGKLFGGLFGDKTLKSLRGLVRGEYGIEVKSDLILKNLKALGESKFGKEAKKKQIETVRLPEAKELLAEYAERTGQKGNSKLKAPSALADPFNPANRFKVALMERGGFLGAGQMAIVGERRPELFIPQTSGRIVPSLDGLQGGGGRAYDHELLAVLDELRAAVAGLRGIPKGQVVEQGLSERPGAAARAVRRSFHHRTEDSQVIRDLVNTR
jgi:tape measure domain-containing protein